VQGFFNALWREIQTVWANLMDYMMSIFEPQSGWLPKAILGVILLVVIFWVSKRGTKS
jgi:hypothetical protein